MGNFGERIKAYRKAMKLSQKELGEKIGALNTSISNWENNLNMPNADQIMALCEVFGISPRELLGANEDALDPEEVEMIKQYRSLSKTRKAVVLNLISSILEDQMDVQ